MQRMILFTILFSNLVFCGQVSTGKKTGNEHLRGYTLILTECKDYSEVAAARNFILKQGGSIAIIGSKNVMLGWIDPSISNQLVGHYGITAIHYKPLNLNTLKINDRQTLQTVAFFNSAASGALGKRSLNEKGNPVKKLDYYDGLSHPAISIDDYLKNLEQKKLNVQSLKKNNQLLEFKTDGSLLTGNSDVMVGTVAVAVFFVESNGAIDPNLYTWNSTDEDYMYQLTLDGLSWWSSMATQYGKAVSFNIIPHYHTDSVCQQPYEPILHYTYEDNLWIDIITAKSGFQTGDHFSRVEAYNTWLRSTYSTDWAYSIFIAYNPSPSSNAFKDGYGGYAYLGGPYTQILFTWFSDGTVAHECGHIFWAPDEYYIPGYSGCGEGATGTKSGFPNGNCEVSNVNSVDCMMKHNSSTLCAFTPAHIGWITEVPRYNVETNPSGLLVGIQKVQSVSPQEFPWGRGWEEAISVVTPQTLNGRRYDFLSWSDGGTQSHYITVPDSTTSYIANFSLGGETPQTWLLYQRSNGLPSSNVHVVTISGQRDVWVGTDAGLVKFDGTNWTVYNTSNSRLPSNDVSSITIDKSGAKWIGTFFDSHSALGGGLVKYDDTNWTVYNSLNSGLPVNWVTAIAIDDSGSKWIGTYAGLIKFDGTNWTVYNRSNSGLPSNDVRSIAIDKSGDKWIGTFSDLPSSLGGLAKFDGINWTVYNSSNSGLPDNYVSSISIDSSGNKWIGTVSEGLEIGGLAKFDGTNWTVYRSSNSGLPDNIVLSLATDGSGNKWIGTGFGGFAKYDGTNWMIYNSSNSGLPDDYINSIAIDASGNKWIGTAKGGLAVYNGGGVVSVKEITSKNLPETFVLFQNYPNPYNPSTNISFNLPTKSFVSLKVFDIIGREVATLMSQEKSAGTYQVMFDASKLPSGVYFYRLTTGTLTQAKKMLVIK